MEGEKILPSFNLEPADNAGTRWEKWARRFDNFLIAKDVKTDARKKAMLLHLAGEEVFDLSESVGVADGDDISRTKEKLQNYFAPKRNTEYEIFVFRQATKHQGESLDKLNARLTSLSKYCNFTDTERDMKSQIIQKCLNEKVRDKGLTNANITLADLLTYGRTLEATKLQTMAMLNQ
ncbi:hypothetical protein SNE40_006012 [Patella caerulea]|uniref:Uncharacterized protein n=1 Tax=Patella caerulea TaxID=87958 RepID=A0AAN8PZE0_PATCE